MSDTFSKEQRSRIMSHVKGKNTKPEKIVRSIIHNMGYRFRLNVTLLPGKPDIVLASRRKIIFVNGCFWHHHRGCPRGNMPSTNTEFWKHKIFSTVKRDRLVRKELKKQGWSVLTVWECELRNIDRLKTRLDLFLNS